jgi:hypothetical protein
MTTLIKRSLIGQQLDFNTFLTREAGAGEGKGPRAPYTQDQEINDMAAKTLIDGIVKSLLVAQRQVQKRLKNIQR